MSLIITNDILAVYFEAVAKEKSFCCDLINSSYI